MANNEQQNSDLIWRYFTSGEPFIKCNICNVLYNRHDLLFDTDLLKEHIEREHLYIVRQIKEEIKLTWLLRYFAFNIKCETIRCIFCEKDIRVLDGVKNLRYHMIGHDVNENTINYLRDDKMMVSHLSPEIYMKIIQSIRDEITNAGLSSYFSFDTLRYKYTKVKCAICYRYFNILVDKQILKDHLSVAHHISK